MVTQKEFMEILENHLTLRADGSVYIKDPKLAEKFADFLKQNAKKEKEARLSNAGCANIICW